MRLIEDALTKKHINPIEINDILTITNHITKNNYAQFKGTIYEATDGLPMGLSCSGILADIFIYKLERQIMKSKHAENIIYYRRYVDDILILWKNNKDNDINKFHEYINKLHQNINFTIELENNNSINFLDTTITKFNNKITFDIYRKPTHSNTIIPANSYHSFQHKLAAFNSLTHRTIYLPLTETSKQKEKQFIKKLAKENGYNPTLIDKIFKKHENKKSINQLGLKPIESKANTYRSIQFPGLNINNKLKAAMKQQEITLTNKTKNNLRTLLCNNKTKKEPQEHSGIYEIKCSNCPAIYIGQSGRQIKFRLKEHTSKNGQSTFGRHLTENNHTFNTETGLKIIHKENKGRRLDLLETLEIKNAIKQDKQIINEQTDFYPKPIHQRITETYNNTPIDYATQPTTNKT